MSEPVFDTTPAPWQLYLRACHQKDADTCPSPDCREYQWPCRLLPNGWRLHIYPMLFNVRLCLSSPEDGRIGCFTDGWCFDRSETEAAGIAFLLWDGVPDPPGPWKKHINSGRRGPGAGPDPFAKDVEDHR